MKIFISYSHKDEYFKNKLKTHLSSLEKSGSISTWNDREIKPGDEWNSEIIDGLEQADIVLLLISADFIYSEYCYDIEVSKAIEFHIKKEKKLIPIIVRYCDWKDTPFAHIQALPTDGIPITSNKWNSEDEAFLNVVNGIRKLIEKKKKLTNIRGEVTIPSNNVHSRKVFIYLLWLLLGAINYFVFFHDNIIYIWFYGKNSNPRSIKVSEIFYDLIFGLPLFFLVITFFLFLNKLKKWECIIYTITMSFYFFVYGHISFFFFTNSINYFIPLFFTLIVGVGFYFFLNSKVQNE